MIAKGCTMNKPMAKATKSTGSSRCEVVLFHARSVCRSRFLRSATACPRSSWKPPMGSDRAQTGGVLTGEAPVGEERWTG